MYAFSSNRFKTSLIVNNRQKTRIRLIAIERKRSKTTLCLDLDNDISQMNNASFILNLNKGDAPRYNEFGT